MLVSQLKMRKAKIALLLAAAMGPLDAEWLARGPFGGSAQNLAIDPRHHLTLLAGTRTARLFRSVDGARSWQPLPFPRLYHVSIYSLAIDPQRDGIYWVGVAAEVRGAHDPSAGLYESDDAGKTWKQVNQMRGRSIYALAIWPGDERVMAAGTDEGVWRTTDAGANWERASTASNDGMQTVVSLAFDPKDANVIYAGTPHLPWKTTDGGKSWRSIHDGMIDDSDVFTIRVDASQPDRIYASACSGIYCSRNAGGEWTKLHGIPGTDRRTHSIVQDPQHPETLYAGTTVGIWKTTDGGATWVKKSTHNINGLVVDPLDGRTLYLATEAGGIYKSTDGGETYRAANQGFVNRNITGFAARAGGRTTMLAATAYDGEFGGLFRSDDEGKSWALVADHQRLLDQNIVSFAVSPVDGQRIWAASFDGLLRSTDGGVHWERPNCFVARKEEQVPLPQRAKAGARRRVPPPPPLRFPLDGMRIFVLRYDSGGGTLYAGTSDGLFVSTDGGVYWKMVRGGAAGQAVLDVYVPGGETRALALRTAAGLWFSPDRGVTWKALKLAQNPEAIYDVALDDGDAQSMIAATSAGLLLTEDEGKSWTLCEKGLPVKGWFNAVAFDPVQRHHLYAAEGDRIYESADGGATWKKRDTTGLDQIWIRSILPAPEGPPGALVVVSRASGVYTERAEVSTASARAAAAGESN
jgi:photosystem II stability/assembly factor-like uncharacterized protein